jgi:glycosyltransferase involved in cell wall biosynthesis
MNVIIKGPLLSVTGYGIHARQVFAWALSKGWTIYCQVVPWGICTYYLDPDAEDGLIGEVMERTIPFPDNVVPDLSLQILLPDEWEPNLARNNIGITAGVETDICSPHWIEACKTMSHVIVPSTFTKQTFVTSGLHPDHISCIPEAFTCGLDDTKEKLELISSLDSLPTNFNFLFFGQLTGQSPDTDRKNTFWGLKWMSEIFKNDPDIGIVIKTNLGRLTAIDRRRTKKVFSDLVAEIRTGPYPKFYLAHGLMDKYEISGLYQSKKIKALIAPTRGEGWGLPILDAAVNGLPVIATNHSGHLDFLKNVKFLPLDYDLVDVHQEKIDNRIFIPGMKWAHVRESSFKKRLIKFRKASDLPTQWAEDGAKKIKKKYCLEAVMKEYDELWEKLLDRS